MRSDGFFVVQAIIWRIEDHSIPLARFVVGTSNPSYIVLRHSFWVAVYRSLGPYASAIILFDSVARHPACEVMVSLLFKQ